MACRDEDIGDGAKADEVAQKERLERLLEIVASAWRYYCLAKGNERENERFRRMDAQLQAFAAKGKAWRQECHALYQKLIELLDTALTTGCVTPADWDIVTAGKEYKLKTLFETSHPRWNWPRQVPYLNLIAFHHHEFEESRLRLMFMKRYYGVTLEISKRGAVNLEDSTEGIGGAISVAQEHTQEQNPAAVEKQLYSTIVSRLTGQRVLGRDWDANSFVDTIFEQIRVDPTDEAKQRAIEIVEELVERWHDDNGHNGDSDDEWDLDEVVSPYGSCDSSAYKRFCMGDDPEASHNKILGKVIDSYITSKNGFFYSRII